MSTAAISISKSWALPYKPLLILFCYSFFLVLIVGSDGWFRQESIRTDSAWFFMSGKSWMEGLVPYRDFTDSKGPLLWLIYGMGYLISNHSLQGLLIFQILSYWINFYILYKIAYLLTGRPNQSLLASMLLGIFYFYPCMHFQMRIEDLCQVFQSLTFYVLFQCIYRNEFQTKYGTWLGISAGCLLMMKYSYFITLMVPTGLLILYFVTIKHNSVSFIKSFLIGLAIVVIPFLIYFIIVGALDSFLNEYFFNTGKTIINVKSMFDEEATSIRQRWPFKLWNLLRAQFFWGEFFRFTVAGIFFTLYRFRKSNWFISIIFIWYICSVLLYSTVEGEGYYLMLSIFIFGAMIMITECFKSLNLEGSIMGGALILAFLAILSTHYVYSEFYDPKRDQLVQRKHKEIALLINQREKEIKTKPTVVYYNTSDGGEHIGTNAIAGTKYWAMHAGMTRDMAIHHREDIFTNRPDFVFTENPDENFIERLETNNYVFVTEYEPIPSLNGKTTRKRRLYMLI